MMPATTLRSLCCFVVLAIAAAACGSSAEGDEASTVPAQTTPSAIDAGSDTVDETAPSSTVATTLAPEELTADEALVVPVIPLVLIPPVTGLNRAGNLIAEALTDATAEVMLPFGGLEVFGAQCNNDGRIVLEAWDGDGPFNAGNGFVGSFTDQGITVAIREDGSGSYSTAGLRIIVESDGSGSFVNGTGSIAIEPDGSGRYVSGDVTIEINPDGSGTYAGPDGNIVVAADGSGAFTSDTETIVNNGDGSGTYSGPLGDVIILGDGTGTQAGEELLVQPLPPVPIIDTLPALDQLAPIGPTCATVVRLASSFLFDVESSDLRAEADAALVALAELVAETETPIEINGHNDPVGSIGDNLNLSQRRAEAVVARLRALGVTTEMIPVGVGSGQPVAPNQLSDGSDNPAGRQANRRVEIIVGQ